MDKYEYRIRAEQIVKLVKQKKYAEAMKIADGIDWNRVKNVQMLCTVSEIYEKNKKYEESREVLYLAYDRSPVGRMIVYKLVELSILLNDLQEAINYFHEYTQLAPNDTNIYILKYKLYKANNASVETLISILEEFRDRDYHEEWGLELANLYAQGGYIEQCILLCDDLDLWFNDGPYVMAALELKEQFAPLTPSQQRKYENHLEAVKQARDLEKMMKEKQAQEAAERERQKALEQRRYEEALTMQQEAEEELEEFPETDFSDDEPVVERMSSMKTLNVQDLSGVEEETMPVADDVDDEDDEEIEENRSGGVFSLFGRIGKAIVEPVESEYEEAQDEIDEAVEESGFVLEQVAQAQEQYEESAARFEAAIQNLDQILGKNSEALKGNTGTIDVGELKQALGDEDDDEIQIQTPVMNPANKYDTMNLQKELAKSIQQLLEATEMDVVDSTLENVKKLVEDSNIPELTETMRFRTVKASMLNNWAKKQAQELSERPEVEYTVEINRERTQRAQKLDEIKRQFQPERPDVEVLQSIKLKPTKEDRKRAMEENLTQESDGQIGLVIPDEVAIEKQITGQLNIEDILKEWERQKMLEETEKEKLELEEARSKALNETQEFMSQVIDLLNQCIPGDAKAAEAGRNFSKRLLAIQDALNSTKDLSEISELNKELAVLLDEIAPEAAESQKEVAAAESSGEEVEEPAVDGSEEEPKTEKAEESVVEDVELPETEEAEEAVSDEEEMRRMMEDALQKIGEEVAGTDTEQEDEDAADAIESTIEITMPEGIEGIVEEKSEDVNLFTEESVTEESEVTAADDEKEEVPTEEELQSEVEFEATNQVESEDEEKIEQALDTMESVENVLEEMKKVEEGTFEASVKEAVVKNVEGNEELLSEEQKDVFSYFTAIHGMSRQLTEAVKTENLYSHMIITGVDGSGKTSLAMRIVKAQQMGQENPLDEVAKIKAASLNNKDVADILKKVEGGVLIIEKAGILTEQTMTKLDECLEDGAKVQLFLATKKKSVERLKERNEKFMSRFGLQINLPIYSNKELVEFGKSYAKVYGYVMDDMAVLALFSRLGTVNTDSTNINLEQVKEIIDGAIIKAEKRRRKMLKRLFGKKKASNILLEEDFEV